MSKQRTSSKLKIFVPSDIERNTRLGQCWVISDGKVYDVKAFASDHPGGDELITAHAGEDVTQLMKDPTEHAHSAAAYDLLDMYQIGVLADTNPITCTEDNIVDETFYPDETRAADDFLQHHFFDLDKPLLPQIWNSNWSKDFYLHQVHQPRHLPEPALLFGPVYLEVFSRTQWWIVPLIWMPISAALFYRSVTQQSYALSSFNTLLCFFLGNFIWTILEYGMHRCLFHIDDYLPDHPIALTMHFLLHGVHHYLPMDRLRLVMPPLLFAALSFPFTRLAYLLFPVWMANGIISGSFAFYVLYDTMHYALHHTKLPKYIKEMKSYHMKHHFTNYELGFGVTSKMWDFVFGTELPV